MLDHKMYTFLTLCETMNYTLAAQRLHIPQPAVTQHIRALENQYGCKLFTYDGKHLYRGRYTNSSDIVLTYGGPVPVPFLMMGVL